jgi:hypothetical protein
MRMRTSSHSPAPRVYVDRGAYNDMLHVARATKDEVAWFCEVERVDNGMLISNVFVPHQQSNGGTVEITPATLASFADEFLDLYGVEAFNRLHCWGHSHHTMGVTPSQQDASTIDQLCAAIGSPFVGIRINHSGQIQADVALPNGVTYEDVECFIGTPDPERAAQWKEIVDGRLTRIAHPKWSPTVPSKAQYGTVGTKAQQEAEQRRLRALEAGEATRLANNAKATSTNDTLDEARIEFFHADTGKEYDFEFEATVAEGITGVRRLPNESAIDFIERAERLDGSIWPND